jgi:hypothetical protein
MLSKASDESLGTINDGVLYLDRGMAPRGRRTRRHEGVNGFFAVWPSRLHA